MNNQLSIFDTDGISDLEAIREFIELYPEDYQWFLNRVREYMEKGVGFSAKHLVEGFRWETRFRETPQFKFNNNHTAALARQIIRDIPEAAYYMETRKARCDL